MDVTEKKEEGYSHIALKGRMDTVTAPEFDTIFNRLAGEGETRFVIDMGALDYISSAGLRSFLVAAKKLKAVQGRIVLTALNDVVKKVFDISGFNMIIPIVDSLNDAIPMIHEP